MTTKEQTIPNISGNSPFEKWTNLKKYILTQVDIIDREVPWSNTEPEWWLEMQEIDMKIRKITISLPNTQGGFKLDGEYQSPDSWKTKNTL